MLENCLGCHYFHIFGDHIFFQIHLFLMISAPKTSNISRAYGAISPSKMLKIFSALNFSNLPLQINRNKHQNAQIFRPPKAAKGCHYSHYFSESHIFSGVPLVLRIFGQMLPKKLGCQYKRGAIILNSLVFMCQGNVL